MNNTNEYFTCIKCGISKPLTEYADNYGWSSGKVSTCKTCVEKRRLELIEIRKDGINTQLSQEELGDTYYEIEETKLVLERIGYDLSKNIHEQFVERIKLKHGVNLNRLTNTVRGKYKPRNT